ncbi:MAG: TetR/AcrR family transcriptional regulator [Calditrichales bacterium]|nr:MAG: TetR/AcrR family transcriptional regulator [Calditrichales bacterium]
MPRVVNKEIKKLEILQAAMKVFAEKGIFKSRIIEIAEKAGVGKGTVYEYFRSKEEIFAAAFSLVHQNTMKAIETALHEEKDPSRQLYILVETTIKGMLNTEDHFGELMMEFWAEGVRTKDLGIMNAIDLRNLYAEYRSLINKIIKDGIEQKIFRELDCINVSAVLIGAFDGLLLQWVLDPKVIDLDKVAVSLLDTFLKGIER